MEIVYTFIKEDLESPLGFTLQPGDDIQTSWDIEKQQLTMTIIREEHIPCVP